MTAFLTALALWANPSVHPWPIGPGPRYTPPARSAVVAAGRPVGVHRCGAAGETFQVHVELFVNRRVVVLPARIGVGPGSCVYPLRTLAPTGVVEVSRGSSLHVSDLFRVWGQALGLRRVASFASSGPVRGYVGGRRVLGPVGAIPLTPGAQIVLELGRYVAPHPFFLFPGGDS